MNNKDHLILVLLAGLIASLIFGGYFYMQPRETVRVETKTKIVRKFEIKPTVNSLLNSGVGSAWEDTFTKGIKADCFSTEVMDDGISIFSYCKLRKRLTEDK